MVANLSWDIYAVPDKEEQACAISQEMIHIKNPSKIMKNTY